ncbi:glycosyltransferase [Geomonas sp. RF6]|uniref:glycosyltransferase n=1 Tax=Geomonas sp. RF6 TaxID=2897342 RepID=UPI001E63BAA5|nr:glycosyltransferase [Geomonas sp. RF6]UFS69726.1 glycosyltransferase [Geomonas sp. RF6]
MTTAPIVLFVYNRPWHTRQTVEALARNPLAPESDLLVYSDAARTAAAAEAVGEVRAYLKTIRGFRSVQVTEREENLGVARSVIAGVSDAIGKFGEAIVVEDDLVTSPHFLGYMNDALRLYRDVEEVVSIHGYLYPVAQTLPESFFLKGADCWGWATWKRGWDLFEPDGRKLQAALAARKLERRFEFNGTYPYCRLLEDQIAGRNDSWAIRWYASALLHDRLTLYPGRSLVHNIGNDLSGTHCDNVRCYDTEMSSRPISLAPLPPEEDRFALHAFECYFRKIRPSRCQRLLARLAGVFR